MSHEIIQPDFGTGQKKLGIYLFGVFSCAVLTLLAFGVVMFQPFSKGYLFAIIYVAACLQFVIQLICFLRLNVETTQGRSNVMSFAFTCVILLCVVLGSLWIMWELNMNMMGEPMTNGNAMPETHLKSVPIG